MLALALLIFLAGCNLPSFSSPIETPTPVSTLAISTSRQPTFTSISTFTPTVSTETPFLQVTLMPSPTFLYPGPETRITQQKETQENDSLQGSVLLQSGLCCIGGIVGTQVNLRKEFLPPVSYGPIIEMRRKEGMFCFLEDEMADAPWVPFVPSVTEPYVITAINWIGHYLSVQYQDNLGHISPVVCDDISVEGMPAPQTSGP